MSYYGWNSTYDVQVAKDSAEYQKQQLKTTYDEIVNDEQILLDCLSINSTISGLTDKSLDMDAFWYYLHESFRINNLIPKAKDFENIRTDIDVAKQIIPTETEAHINVLLKKVRENKLQFSEKISGLAADIRYYDWLIATWPQETEE